MTHSIIFLQAAEQLEITICSTKVWCTNISKRSEVGNPLPKISSHLVRNPLNLQPNGDTGLLKICAPKSYHPLWNDLSSVKKQKAGGTSGGLPADREHHGGTFRWLGYVHSWHKKIDDYTRTPGDEMLAAYKTLTAIPAWQKYDGANFAIYDSHPGYVAGDSSCTLATETCP